jgi:hypothetical protein
MGKNRRGGDVTKKPREARSDPYLKTPILHAVSHVRPKRRESP